MPLIIGCGYLGEKLALSFKKRSTDALIVTTRSEMRAESLQEMFPNIVKIDGNSLNDMAFLIEKAKNNCKILILTLAAKDPSLYESTYLNTVLHLKSLIDHTTYFEHIIYTSSTSVYGHHGNKIVTEESDTLTDTDQGKILLETEKVLNSLKTAQRKITILRLSEIYGPSRELLNHVMFSKKKSGDGSLVAHTIHVEDIISAIHFCIDHRIEGIYNLCDDDRCTRKELYDFISLKYHLPKVVWNPMKTSFHQSNKIVSNEKIKGQGFRFVYPHRVV